MSGPDDINTFVFTAIATTGFPTKIDPKSAKITELCFLAITKKQLTRDDGVEPKILYKLKLCFNPEKDIHPKAAEVSGLTNEDLEDCTTFDQQARTVVDFLKKLPQPIRLVAHQGDNFHFRLLFLHLEATVPVEEFCEFLCTDSLKVFKEIYPELTSKSLDNVHKLTGKEPKSGAEGRCQMLLDIVRGMDKVKFEEFCTECHDIKCNFSLIPIDSETFDNNE